MDNSNKLSRKQIRTPHIPQEIIDEILSMLPAKSLSRFSCVSKLWRSLISSRKFIKEHLQFSIRNTKFTDQALIAVYMKFTGLDADRFDADATLLSYPDQAFRRSAHSMCSNGLCCTQESKCDFFLSNPCTGKSYKLPRVVKLPSCGQLDGYGFIYGFGFDEINDDYKVVAVFWNYRLNAYVTKMYSLKTGSWKRVENFTEDPRLTFHQVGKLVAGKLHWDRTDDNHTWSIVAIDLASEVPVVVELPDGDVFTGKFPSVHVFKECLCVLNDCSQDQCCKDVWIMKEYGMKDSWCMAIRVPYRKGPHNYLLPSVCTWCLTQDLEILCCEDKSRPPVLTFYNPETKLYRDPRTGYGNEIIKVDHVQSLVSPVYQREESNKNVCE